MATNQQLMFEMGNFEGKAIEVIEKQPKGPNNSSVIFEDVNV